MERCRQFVARGMVCGHGTHRTAARAVSRTKEPQRLHPGSGSHATFRHSYEAASVREEAVFRTVLTCRSFVPMVANPDWGDRAQLVSNSTFLPLVEDLL